MNDLVVNSSSTRETSTRALVEPTPIHQKRKRGRPRKQKEDTANIIILPSFQSNKSLEPSTDPGKDPLHSHQYAYQDSHKQPRVRKQLYCRDIYNLDESDDDEYCDTLKKEHRRQKNRASAASSRKRRQDEYTALKQQEEELQHEIDILKQRLHYYQDMEKIEFIHYNRDELNGTAVGQCVRKSSKSNKQ
jgi:hypothetical protein